MDSWGAAADEHGIVTLADLRAGGLDSRAVGRLVRAKQLTVLARGWYVVGTPADDEAHHILATRAMLRSHEGRAVASYHSGLLLLGLPTFRADLSRVRLSRVEPGPPRTRAGLSLGRAVPPELIIGESVSAAAACVQVGRSSGPMAALVAADGALHRGMTTRTELRDAVEWSSHHPRGSLVGPFLELADGRRESPGETRLGHALSLMGVGVTPQFLVEDDGFHAFVDFRVDGHKVVIEFDGKVKYGRTSDETDPFGRNLTPNEIVWREKRREDRLRELGYEVVRVIWSELDDPVGLSQRIRSAIRRAEARAAA